MRGWILAFENNSKNVNFAQAGARTKTYLFGDHYKLTPSLSTLTSWLAKGYKAANNQ